MARRQVVVVTGASAGVGRATAVEFAKRGCAVGLIAREGNGLRAAAKEVANAGGAPLEVPLDVSKADKVDLGARQIENEFGPIDVWVNDAMVTVFSPFRSIQPEEFRRVTDVTYLGCVYGTMAALKRMVPRDHGTVVQVGSALAFQGIPLQAAYCGAKHAIRGFTESVRAELFHDGSHVRITEVHLPAMNTPQFRWCRSHLPNRAQPVPPIYQPEGAAQAIVQAAHDKRQEFLLGLPTVKAVLGARFAPWLMTKITAQRAWDQQMTNEAEDPSRPDNLFTGLPRDRGAHGAFDDRARRGKVESWPRGTTWRNFALSAVAGTLGFGVKLVDGR